MSKADADIKLGGLTALCKAQAGIILNECAQTAVLLFGGNGYTKSGQGELVQKLYGEVMGIRIPGEFFLCISIRSRKVCLLIIDFLGGSEDVMLDLAIRQLVKNFQNATKALERPSGSSKL